MNVANETTTNNTCYLLMPLSVSTQYRVTVRAYASKYGDGPNSTVEVFTSKTGEWRESHTLAGETMRWGCCNSSAIAVTHCACMCVSYRGEGEERVKGRGG